MSALQSFANIFSVPDLRKRVIFTFLLLAVYRLGSHIPTPGVDPAAINAFFKSSAGSLFGSKLQPCSSRRRPAQKKAGIHAGASDRNTLSMQPF